MSPMTTMGAFLQQIIDHHQQNPKHGTDCACMDKFIQQFRTLTWAAEMSEQMRIDYVIRKAIDNRY